MWRVVLSVIFSGLVVCQFFDCHDDPNFEPDEGPLTELQFTWLGALQYIHVKNGTPHYFRVPRVVLISRQFVLSTAVDAAHIPDGYALGNVVFGDYERDEAECKVSIEELAAGVECEPAVLLMPIADVLLHPEYKHFGTKTSIALLKLITTIKSTYMVPACLPFKNFLVGKNGKQTSEKIYHVDFVSDVPRDFLDEEKEVSRLHLLPRELCYLYENPTNATRGPKNRMACTTGCGFHSGSPCLVHEHTGHWSIVSIAQGGSPCPDPLRTRRPPSPPRHTLIHPYVPWITAAITGKAVGAFAKDDPFGYVMPRSSIYDILGHSWVGHWWMGGLRCHDRGEAAQDLFKFYHEVFQVKPVTFTYLTYYMEVSSAHETMIICVKVGMPYRLGQPKVWQLDSPEVKVQVPVVTFSNLYKFQIEAWAYNSTESETSSESSSTVESVSNEAGAEEG
ncbi:CLIP domain-containing serine protease B9-like [Vanessa cardui]|uniref:CLIP domain-containing serine protease B9-like n=1 Tax=Vanessa cardui TaxID=171605 RepID=UPI001F13BD50|nr:CLIP domain-containing serine protease B9-like [Vanessa cardui]